MKNNPLYWLVMLLMSVLTFFSQPTFAQQGGNVATFDHNRTGFILEGAHRVLRCDSCHFQGQFKGTPKDCAQCHRNGGLAPGKTASHVPTGATSCDACHRTASWNQGTFRHLATQGVMQGACTTCHNGNFVSANAQTKPAVHPVTSAQCDSCHTTNAWLPAGYTHANAVPGQCATCHNGTRATGKPASHIPTTASCDACHGVGTTFSTLAVSLDRLHQNMTGPMATGNCSTCHNGAFLSAGAQTKPATHIPTTAQCDTCHRSTSSWATSTFDHSTATPAVAGRCSTCHNSSIALGKPTSHIPTSAQCDACHSGFASFRPAAMDHLATTGPIAQGNCASCHSGAFVSVNALTKPAAHIPTTAQCDSCHLNGYINWAPATMNHAGMAGKCITCHSGGFLSQNAQTKPATHIATTAQCDTCHRSTTSWANAVFNHSAATPSVAGRCSSCHNGTTALGKSTTHIPTASQCENCHTNFTSFRPAQMNHAGLNGQCSTCHNGSYTYANAQARPITHIPAPGQCDNCHVNGFVSWTPANMNHTGLSGLCSNCHNGAYLVQNAQTKPATHIPTTAQCDTCHNSTLSWATATFNHASASPPVANRCSACHGVTALGKPTTHIPTTSQCDVCHTNTIAFAPASMNHAAATGPSATGNCATCHNGAYTAVNAQAKPTTHIPTTAQCDSCHSTAAWLPTSFSHAGVVAGTCATCHNGTSARGKTSTHIPTTASCDVCHRNYTAFAPANMSHSGTLGPVAAGNCATCHSGAYIAINAQTKTATHIATTAQCDTCHTNAASTLSWATATFTHSASAYGTCSTCHNNVTALGKPTTHIPTSAQCDTCHNNFVAFRPAVMNHTGTTGPVATGNCSSCHNGAYAVVNALAKPAGHIPTTAQCDNCHISGYISWTPSVMNHTGLNGQCSTCHNGAYLVQNAQTKPATHIPTTAQCDTCHNSTLSWATATFNHASASPPVANRCSACHGVTALGKPTTHIPTTSQCDVCHTNTIAFAPASMNHAAATGPSATGNCATCHNGAYTAVNAQAKPTTHIPTTAQCDSCHSTAAWLPTSFSHAGVVAGTCATCHNGTSARGKTSTHIPTTASCDVCHRNYTAFAPANMSHSGTLGPVAAGNCATCHSGAYIAINAQTKTATHIATTAQCDTCHTNAASTLSWATATFNHAAATPPVAGRCSTCHNGTTALGKSGTHIPTTSQCDVCHISGFTAFAPATMNHATTTGPVATGNCATCHSGAYVSVNAQIKSATHIPTTQSCDVCHGTTAWRPTTFTHAGIAPGTCSTCHNTTYATGKPTLHIPTSLQCDSCHRMGVAWLPVITPWPHTGVVAGSCATCHVSSYPNIDVKPTNHVPTNAACDACHQSTATWLTIRFNHNGIVAGTCATCHGSTYPGVMVKPGNHIPTTTPTGLPGNECSLCHSSTTTFATERMNHGTIQTSCVTCHDSTSSYLGSMQKINRSRHHNAGAKDCSSSGCHKPLGNIGRPYSAWN